MKSITYLNGDLCNPITDGKKIIIHCCNDIFVMGAGVALALRKKWPIIFDEYKKFGRNEKEPLGKVNFVKVGNDIVVANMIGQCGIYFTNNVAPIRYNAINECLKKVAEVSIKHNASVHAPYLMGSGLAGGSWEKIEEMIVDNLCKQDIDVYIYDVNNKRNSK